VFTLYGSPDLENSYGSFVDSDKEWSLMVMPFKVEPEKFLLSEIMRVSAR